MTSLFSHSPRAGPPASLSLTGDSTLSFPLRSSLWYSFFFSSRTTVELPLSYCLHRFSAFWGTRRGVGYVVTFFSEELLNDKRNKPEMVGNNFHWIFFTLILYRLIHIWREKRKKQYKRKSRGAFRRFGKYFSHDGCGKSLKIWFLASVRPAQFTQRILRFALRFFEDYRSMVR